VRAHLFGASDLHRNACTIVLDEGKARNLSPFSQNCFSRLTRIPDISSLYVNFKVMEESSI